MCITQVPLLVFYNESGCLFGGWKMEEEELVMVRPERPDLRRMAERKKKG